MMKKSLSWVADNRATILYIFFALTAVCLVYFYKLGSLVQTNSIYENASYLGVDKIDSIINNVAFAPITVVQFAVYKFDATNIYLLRTISVLTTILAIIIFYRVISKWHTNRVAFLATILFAVSSYSLHLGRFTNKEALFYLLIPSILLIGTWLKSKKYVGRLLYSLPIVAILLYLPGFIYIVLALSLIFRKRLALAFRFVDSRIVVIASSISVLLLVPLLYSLVIKPAQVSEFLGIDLIVKADYEAILQRFISIPSDFFYNGLSIPHAWLVGTPILEIGTIVLLTLGVYSYARGPHTLRFRLLAILSISGILLIGFGSLVSYALIIPVIYIFVANGLSYLLQSWFTVFPKNPAARISGIVLVGLMVVLIAGYHLQRYFVAWPNSPETTKPLNVSGEKVIQ